MPLKCRPCPIHVHVTSTRKANRGTILKLSVVVASTIFLLWPCSFILAWGHEGHEIVALIAEHYMTETALNKTSEVLRSATLVSVANWADEYRYDHPETGPWHYIDIPLKDHTIDMARECPNGDCVIAKTEQFLAVLKNPRADPEKKVQSLKFVVHFLGDLHQPLHVENDGDVGGTYRHVIFDGYLTNLHWVWNTGLLEDVERNPETFAAELESRITDDDRKEWAGGSIEAWVLEAHELDQSVAYGDLGGGSPTVITRTYEQKADPVIELQLEKAGVRLASVLDNALK